MKHFITTVLCGLLLCSVARGQNREMTTANITYKNAAGMKRSMPDTLTDADSSYLYWNGLSAAYDVFAEVVYTRTSGTAGGTILLQGSNDGGITWFTLSSVAAGTILSQYEEDSAVFASLSSGAVRKYWIIQGNSAWRYKDIRAFLITSGTQTGYLTGKLYYRKP